MTTLAVGSSNPVLHIVVIGFHHKKGCQVILLDSSSQFLAVTLSVSFCILVNTGKQQAQIPDFIRNDKYLPGWNQTYGITGFW